MTGLAALWLLSFCGLFSMADDGYNTITEYEHIELSSEVSVAGHRMCQDGQYVYFKRKPDCIANNRFLIDHHLPHFDCRGDLKLAPISELELIHTFQGLTLQRFYNISLTYSVRKKQQIPGSQPPQYKTVGDEVRTIEKCENRPYKKTPPLLKERQAYSQRENFLVRELLKSGIYAVNKSQGQVSSVNILSTPQVPHFRRAQNLQDHIAIEDSDTGEITQRDLFQLKTPYCGDLNNEQIINLLGGWGGGGSQSSIAAIELENQSKPLEVLDLMTSDIWEQAEKGKVTIQEPVFSIRCL